MKKIAIHSVPRSGSTWLGSIFDSSPNVAYRFQPLFSFGHKSQLSENSNAKEISRFFDDILSTSDEFVLQKEAILKGKVPSFTKKGITHVAYKEVRYHHILQNALLQDPELKVIGLVRNSLSVINSWLHAPKEFRADLGWKVEDEWLNAPNKNSGKPEEFNGFMKWKEVTQLFLELNKSFPKQFFLIRYDDLLRNTSDVVRQLFDFVDLPMSEQTVAFINQSKSTTNADAYSVYKEKTVDNDWVDSLPEHIIKAITEDLKATNLEQFI